MFQEVLEKELTVLKTEQGYLHHDIDEGLYLEKGETNYGFTDDPREAYDFYGNEDVPKYMGIMENIKFRNVQEVCDYLGGELVKVRVTTTVSAEEINERGMGNG